MVLKSQKDILRDSKIGIFFSSFSKNSLQLSFNLTYLGLPILKLLFLGVLDF